MELKFTGDELNFLARLTGASGVLGVSSPELDDPKKADKITKTLTADLFDKDLILNGKRGPVINDTIKPIIKACTSSDLTWIIVDPEKARTFFHITPDVAAEVSIHEDFIHVQDFTNLKELFSRLGNLLKISLKPNPGIAFQIDKDVLSDLQSQGVNINYSNMLDALVNAGIAPQLASLFVSTYTSPIGTFNIATKNNHNGISKTMDIFTSPNCNIYSEPLKQNQLSISSFDFPTFMKKITFEI